MRAFREPYDPDAGADHVPTFQSARAVAKAGFGLVFGVLAYTFALAAVVGTIRLFILPIGAAHLLQDIESGRLELGTASKLGIAVAFGIWWAWNTVPSDGHQSPVTFVVLGAARMFTKFRGKLLDRAVALAFQHAQGSLAEAWVRIVVAVVLVCVAIVLGSISSWKDWARVLLIQYPSTLQSLSDQFPRIFLLLITDGAALLALFQASWQLKTAAVILHTAYTTPIALEDAACATPESSDFPPLAVAHLSDLHLTGCTDDIKIEGGPGGNEPMHRVVQKHINVLRSADLLLITGDMTDAGTREEWRTFFSVFGGDLTTHLVIVPGNHDVNITNPADTWAFEEPDSPLRNIRLIRMMAAIDRVQGQRAIVIDNNGSTSTVSQYLVPHAEQLNLYARAPTAPLCTIDPLAVWEGMFPMAVDLPKYGIVLLILDSNDSSALILTNAFGRISSTQLERLVRLRSHFQDRAVVVALHHHLVLPSWMRSATAKARLLERGLVLQNSSEVVQALRDLGCAVALHGHRHVEYAGRIGSMHIRSSRSTTLGDESPRATPDQATDPGFHMLTLQRNWTGTLSISSDELLLV